MLDLVEARLKDTPGVQYIGGALDLSTVLEQPLKNDSALFVVPLADYAEPNLRQVSAPVHQLVKERIAVVIGLKTRGSATGVAGNKPLTALKNAVKVKLYGWVPAADYTRFELGPAALLRMKDFTLFYQMEFITESYQESQNG